ncbi:MAG: 1-phosphofructokinase family hexose kinase [Acidimicrobiia bacterium]
MPESSVAESSVRESSVTVANAFVFAPDPLVTVTVEVGQEGDEIHIHAGGQGFWVARMISSLGIPVTLCGPFGGETGRVARGLIESEGIAVQAVATAGDNGAYIHDRRHGERAEVARTPPEPLSRHELDDLYSAALVGALESRVSVLGGPGPWETPPVPSDAYRRLAADLAANGRTVVADLSGEALACALEGGVTLLKVSHEELVDDGRAAAGGDVGSLLEAMDALRREGAANLLVTRAADPALALVDGDVVEVVPPALETVDHRGAGDSMTAGLVAGLAQGRSFADSLRLGAAAGALNVTRRGLATGDPQAIERLSAHIELRPLPEREEAAG